MKGMLDERAVAGDEGGVIRQWQQEQGEEGKDAGMEVRTSTRCVRRHPSASEQQPLPQ